MRWLVPFLFAFIANQPGAVVAQLIVGDPPPGVLTSALGVTRQGASILFWSNREDFDLHMPRTRILLIGGVDGLQGSVDATHGALRWFYVNEEAAKWKDRYLVSAVPAVMRDGFTGPANTANTVIDTPGRRYPPAKGYYDSPSAPEAAYLWRWLGMYAPDLVIDVRSGDGLTWFAPDASHTNWKDLTERLRATTGSLATDELVVQLNRLAPCETGSIPALRLATKDRAFLPRLLEALDQSGFRGPSSSRRELQLRLARTPRQVAEQLTEHYGHTLDQAVYIPAMALIARLNLGELGGDATHRTAVERIVAPYVDGSRAAKPDNGSALSGHLIFCELADRSSGPRRDRYIELAKAAADQAFGPDGRGLESMPYHTEMSDALFMGGPILAHVGALTGEPRYFEACVRHLRFMRKLCLRPDGLYRHSPLDEAAWGRGNGFPAIGVALSLGKFPAEHPDRAELRTWLEDHLRALLPGQDATGCWHQVIDRPESYRELTATCMIAYAMSRGIREGWLARRDFDAAVERAWYAIRTRAPANGRLVDVCTGTGKQASLRAYYDRPAILGPDERGGAMSLLIATELAQPFFQLDAAK